MKKKDLEKRLRTEGQENIPDLKAQILAQADAEGLFDRVPQTSPQTAVVRRRKPVRLGKVFAALAACVACIALILPFALRSEPIGIQESYTTVCMKINPAVEFIVDEGKVTRTKALNKDGAVLLVHTSLEGVPVEQACLTVAQLAGGRNLITEKGITLYVAGENEEQIERKISESLQAQYLLQTGGADYQALAERLVSTYGISKGKARLVAEAMTLCGIPEKKAVRMSAEDLHEEIEDYQEEEMDAFERELLGRFDSEYESYKAEVSELLVTYRERLEALNEMSEGEREEEIAPFNRDFSKLGEDFQIDTRISWERAYGECMEEIVEATEDFAEDPDETFRDLFEDWLEEFQNKEFDD